MFRHVYKFVIHIYELVSTEKLPPHTVMKSLADRQDQDNCLEKVINLQDFLQGPCSYGQRKLCLALCMVLLQNVLPRNVLHQKTSFLQNVLPHNVLPQYVLPQNVHLFKTSSFTEHPPLQNVLPHNVHKYKMSFTTKRPPSKKNLYKKIANQ